MVKGTPNPPDTDPTSPHETPNSEKPLEAPDHMAGRTRQPSSIFLIAPDIDNQTLLEYACESLASATVMLGDFAGMLEGPNRNTLLGIAQVVMLGELAVNKALDNVVPSA